MAHSRYEDSSSSQIPTLVTMNLITFDYKNTIEKLSVKLFNIHTNMIAANKKSLNKPLRI